MHKVVICGIDTGKLPRLSSEECIEYLQKIKQGDKQAQDHFVMCNLRLVLSVVQRFNNRGNSDDLFQVGCVGLMKAVKNFDLKYNVKFSTYAVPMIIGEIRRFLKDSTSIKVSRSMRDIAYKALRAKEELEKTYQKSPSVMEIAEEIDIPVRQVACALDAVSEPISLYESVYKDGEDSLMLMEQLQDTTSGEEKWTEYIMLKDAVGSLSDKEKNVLRLRYFVGKTQVDIANQIGISQAQVSRLEKTALDKIKSHM